MQYFILSHFWPVFHYFFKTVGIYPLKRVGNAELHQTTGCHFWCRYLATTIAIFSIFGGIITCIVVTQLSIDGDFFDLWEEEFGISNSVLDKVIMIWMLSSNFVILLACLINIRSLAEGLKNMQDFLNKMPAIDIVCNPKKKIVSYARIFTWILVQVSSNCLSWACIIHQLNNIFYNASKPTLSTISEVILIACVAFINQVFFFPLYYFVFVYSELYNFILYWSKHLLGKEPNEDLIFEVKLLLDGLKSLGKILAPFFFWITSFYFVQALLLTYFIFATISNTKGPLALTEIGTITSYCLIIIVFIYLLYMFCFMSQQIVTQVQNLQDKILNMSPSSGNRDIMYAALGEFNGFDANGYFTLNNSLLTGMAANFTTYLVILIQFKQSEN